MLGHSPLTARIVDSLYCDAMVLADEARSYFERERQEEVAPEDALSRVELSCESLRVTTRLMHCLAWILNHKAYHAGEMGLVELRRHARLLPEDSASAPAVEAQFPGEAVRLIQESRALRERVGRLDEAFAAMLDGDYSNQEGGIANLRNRLSSDFSA